MRVIHYDLPLTAGAHARGAVQGYASVARGFFQRLMGLMGQREVPDGCALMFPRCRSIHTYWMRIPIDVVWVARPDESGFMRVTGFVASMAPGRVEGAPEGTWGVLEFVGGTFEEAPERVLVRGLTDRDMR